MNDDKLRNGAYIERRCMRDKIRDAIVSRILDGSYAAGKRLIELNLAREFNVSQAPVREALRELEALGLVKSERYRGTRVSVPKASDLKESYEMRAVLEERAAQLAVPCPPEILSYLQDVLRKMHVAAAAGNAATYAKESIYFHRKIVEASANSIFLHTWDTLQLEVRAHIAALHVSGELANYATAHDAILLALRQEDGACAGYLLRQLIERFLATIVRSTEQSDKK